jgi:hypothetical protein
VCKKDYETEEARAPQTIENDEDDDDEIDP